MSLCLDPALSADYRELRHHQLHLTNIMMVDGAIANNGQNKRSGTVSRSLLNGYWGMAASPNASSHTLEKRALDNAQQLSQFGSKSPTYNLDAGAYQGEHLFAGQTPWSQKQKVDLLEQLHHYCQKQFKELSSVTLIMEEETHLKQGINSLGARFITETPRALLVVTFTLKDAQGTPLEHKGRIAGRGGVADMDFSIDTLAPRLETLYRELLDKKQAVPVSAGVKQVILSPKMSGILAHEAMGHPCEADFVENGAVTGHLLGQKVASDLVTMVDAAHHFEEQLMPIPVYVDDEGVQAQNVTLIENGVLKHFLHNRETAARFNTAPTGNARAYDVNDEPLIRMRNTVIAPGTTPREEMIAGIEDGYLMACLSNGQADTTSEFMFGVTLGYEIKDGQLGRPIRDTTIAGTAIDMLKTVDAVSNEFELECGGYCGKGQQMLVSMGGPSLRCKVHVGGK